MKYRETKGYKFLLVEDEPRDIGILSQTGNRYIYLNQGKLIVRKGYAWDGSSIPLKKYYSWLWDADKYCKTASLVHDALCQLMREDLLPKTHKPYADALYRKMCIEGGMKKWEADTRYRWLRKFGGAGIQKRENPRGQIIEI